MTPETYDPEILYVVSSTSGDVEFETHADALDYAQALYAPTEHLPNMPDELRILRVERYELRTIKRPGRHPSESSGGTTETATE